MPFSNQMIPKVFERDLRSLDIVKHYYPSMRLESFAPVPSTQSCGSITKSLNGFFQKREHPVMLLASAHSVECVDCSRVSEQFSEHACLLDYVLLTQLKARVDDV